MSLIAAVVCVGLQWIKDFVVISRTAASFVLSGPRIILFGLMMTVLVIFLRLYLQ